LNSLYFTIQAPFVVVVNLPSLLTKMGKGKKEYHFQVMLGGNWKDYEKEEDNILKRAYMTGHKKAKYSLRGNNYEYDFQKMKQKNVESGKERDIRAPYGMKAPGKPIVPSGPTMVVKVPPGGPGTVIQVPHPKNKSMNIAVEVPKTAKVGAAMIVPVPPLPGGGGGTYVPGEPVAAPYVTDGGGGGKDDKKKDTSLSAGEKAGFAVGGAALIGGMAVAGAVLGDMAGDGAFGDGVADVVGDAGDALVDGADIAGDALGDAGDWLMDVGGDAGDFIMDLF